MKLTAIQCKAFKPKEKPYKKSDGFGMYLEVMPNGSKYWRMKYRINDKEKRLAIGVYPQVSLAEAREKRDQAKEQLRNGDDPALLKKQEKLLRNLNAVNTFELIAKEWHLYNEDRWTPSYGAEILNRLEKDIFPHIGALPISEIKPPIILQTIRKIEARGANEIARRTLQCCGQVFRYAIGEGKAESDPTRDLVGNLKPYKKTHYAAFTSKELPTFLRALENNDARLYAQTRRTMKLMLLTFVRTSELIKAKWEEFDFDKALWIIPAERMKMGKEHVVPLSKQALEILKEQKELTGQWQWVFPNQVRPIKPMSNNTILKALERMGYKGAMTGHGFRALARTTIREELRYDSEVIEKQLAHKTLAAHGEAYDRTQFIDQRTKMMEDWSNYLDEIAAGGQVVEGRFGS